MKEDCFLICTCISSPLYRFHSWFCTFGFFRWERYTLFATGIRWNLKHIRKGCEGISSLHGGQNSQFEFLAIQETEVARWSLWTKQNKMNKEKKIPLNTTCKKRKCILKHYSKIFYIEAWRFCISQYFPIPFIWTQSFFHFLFSTFPLRKNFIAMIIPLCEN